MRAVITGGTKGIGKAIALKLAKEGYDIAICARDAADLLEVKQELEATGVEVLTYIADCNKKEEVKTFCAFIESNWSHVAVFVNNAGVYLPGNILDEEDAVYEQQLELNTSAGYYFLKFFGKMMRKQQNGHIFNICSIASLGPVKDGGSYSVTKSALLCLNNVIRQELATHNVKVTAILPGPTITSSWEGTNIPEAKFITPDDIATLLFTTLNLSSGANVEQIVLKPVKFNL